MGDLVCVRVFFSQPSGERILFPDIQRCKFFPSIIRHERYFFRQIFPCKIFFPSKSVCRIYFFLSQPYPPSKVKRTAPYLEVLFPAKLKALKTMYSCNIYIQSRFNGRCICKNFKFYADGNVAGDHLIFIGFAYTL